MWFHEKHRHGKLSNGWMYALWTGECSMDRRVLGNHLPFSLDFCFEATAHLDCNGGMGSASEDQKSHNNSPVNNRIRDSQEYLSGSGNHDRLEDDKCYQFPIIDDAIEIQDIYSNLFKERVEVCENHGSFAKYSPDGQAIAVRWVNEQSCPDNSYELLTIFSHTGKLLSQSQEPIKAFDWLVDNRPIYAIGKTIYVSNTKRLGDGEPIRTLTSEMGDISRITASPDGTKIVFEMVSARPRRLEPVIYRKARLLSMNIDGSNLRLFGTKCWADDTLAR
jgi:hypothetical protein